MGGVPNFETMVFQCYNRCKFGILQAYSQSCNGEGFLTFPVPGELGYWNPRPPGIPAGNPGECMFRGISGILGEIRGSSGKPAFFRGIPRNFAYENTEISEIFFVTNPRIPDLRRANSPPRNFPENVGAGTGRGISGTPLHLWYQATSLKFLKRLRFLLNLL